VKERTCFPETRLGKEARTMVSKELKKDFVSCSAPHPVKLLAACIQTAFQRFTLSRIIELRGSVVSSLHSYFGGTYPNLYSYLEEAYLHDTDLSQKLPEWQYNIKICHDRFLP